MNIVVKIVNDNDGSYVVEVSMIGNTCYYAFKTDKEAIDFVMSIKLDKFF